MRKVDPQFVSWARFPKCAWQSEILSPKKGVKKFQPQAIWGVCTYITCSISLTLSIPFYEL